MSDDVTPVEVWSLGFYLCEEMEERGWTSGDVAIRMGQRTWADICKDQLIVELIMSVSDDRMIIDDDIFERLATAFGVSTGLFKGLNADWARYPEARVKFEAPDDLYGKARRTMLTVALE